MSRIKVEPRYQPKVAIIVADSFGAPFDDIKKNIQPRMWQDFEEYDVFYVRGKQPSRIQNYLNKFSDKYRYSRLWPVQRMLDQILLGVRARKAPKVTIMKNEIEINLPEGLRYLGIKIISAAEALQLKGYNIFYKTTLSSVVNPKLFKDVIEGIDFEQPFYGGSKINFGQHPFVSGANLFINDKSLHILLRNRHSWNHGLLDDVALGRLLEDKVEIVALTTRNIGSLEDLEILTTEEILENLHFRCKSNKIEREDVIIIATLLERLNASRNRKEG